MTDNAEELAISADSHVIEDSALWQERLANRFQDRIPPIPKREVGGRLQAQPGGWDPTVRVNEMATDGVCQEVLYPSFALSFFSLTDVELQEAMFTVYNDWLVEYCSAAPDRLFGIAAICSYNIDHAVKELEQRKSEGYPGAMIWEVPPPELPFTSEHYDPLWAAAQDLEMPISLHILTGQGYRPRATPGGRRTLASVQHHVNDLIYETTNAISDIIGSGVLERFPRLRFVLVESEASWIPSYLSQWDKYYHRQNVDHTLTMLPSEYFARQVYATFFNDPTIAHVLGEKSMQNAMWSNDYPHPNSTWPNSQEVIQRDLAGLSNDLRNRVVRQNVIDLYGLPEVALATS